MTEIATLTGERAKRLIRDKKPMPAEYHVSGSLDLSGCDLTGITLPTSIGGSLYLRGCKNFTGPSHWIERPGQVTRFRVLASDGSYHLEQTDTDLFTANCRKNLTRDQALAHWKRTDARAVLFTAAIEAAVLP